MISFFVPGPPTAKGRAKVGRVGGHVRMFTPEKTVKYESTVALFASQAMGDRNLFDGPVALDLLLLMGVPVSWSGKKRNLALSGEIIPETKPDCSNVLKAVEDAMNGIVFLDDKQIADLNVKKRYASTPGVMVKVWELS
jgi:Holliday junction resolvase RusA-like endonuclease